jgi:hypothetical protein
MVNLYVIILKKIIVLEVGSKNEMLGARGVKNVDFYIISNEQTQSNRVYKNYINEIVSPLARYYPFFFQFPDFSSILY